MPLMRRVALLLDKGSADHRDVVELYDLRNRIAHGAAELVGPTNLRLHYQRIARLWRVLRP